MALLLPGEERRTKGLGSQLLAKNKLSLYKILNAKNNYVPKKRPDVAEKFAVGPGKSLKPLSRKDLSDGQITPMGRLMSLLPMDLSMTRLVMFGYCFGFLEEAVIIACGMHQQGFFSDEHSLVDDDYGQLQVPFTNILSYLYIFKCELIEFQNISIIIRVIKTLINGESVFKPDGTGLEVQIPTISRF